MESCYNYPLMGLNEIVEKLKNKKIYVFGAGHFGRVFIKEYPYKYNIRGIIDNGDFNNYSLYGKNILNMEGLNKIYDNEKIIIASFNYWGEIAEQLVKNDYKFGNHFFIWNCQMDGLDIDFKDENTKKLIELNEKRWSDKRIDNIENKILIPYFNTTELSIELWSYFANIFAKKYNASIWAVGGKKDGIDNGLWHLYESINTIGYIDETPSQIQEIEIENLLEDIERKIKTIEDVKDIVVYGINCGIDIMRHFLRWEYPQLFINDFAFKIRLKEMLGYIVFWHSYFKENYSKIKTIILWDGLYWREGVLRKLAYAYKIPVYSIVSTTCFKWEYDMKLGYKEYKKFFELLSEEEKVSGINWSKSKMNKHIRGDSEDMPMIDKSTFGVNESNNVLENNNRTKIMICPHYMEDDAFPYGDDMLFTYQWEWLEFLGELSEKTDYDWYLKPHPIEKALGDSLMDEYVHKYTKIKLLDKFISPIQLKKEGIKYALTIHGSIGYEYPLIGINVINAGFNPHVAFDFCLTPKTKEEYMNILSNLDNYSYECNIEEIYQFYAIHFGYYRQRKRDLRGVFFNDDRLRDIRGLVSSKTEYSTDLFKYYVDEVDEKRHLELFNICTSLIDEMDDYKDGVFYKQDLKCGGDL